MSMKEKSKARSGVVISALTLAIGGAVAGTAQAAPADFVPQDIHVARSVLAPIRADELGMLFNKSLDGAVAVVGHHHDHDDAAELSKIGSESYLKGTFDV